MRALAHHQLKRVTQRRVMAWRRIAAQLEELRVATRPPAPIAVVVPPEVEPVAPDPVDVPIEAVPAVVVQATASVAPARVIPDPVVPTLAVVSPTPSPPSPPAPARPRRPVRPRPVLIDLKNAVSSVEAQAESWRK